MNNPDHLRYEFGPFVLDPREHRLMRDGKHLSLAPRDFEILVALVRRAGTLVEKEELVSEVWPDDAFVEEANISRRVYAVRHVLFSTLERCWSGYSGPNGGQTGIRGPSLGTDSSNRRPATDHEMRLCRIRYSRPFGLREYRSTPPMLQVLR